MERKLASVQIIKLLEPIEGADKIERAQVLGWSSVVPKGNFQVGDKCIYIEVDSVLPERPEFEFLRPRSFRIKTIRLKGQVSQGIAFPLNILPECRRELCFEGEDVTDILEVTKYEIPIPAQLAGLIKGAFPGFIPKTDETRIQAVPEVLNRHSDKTFYMTEKLDGSSMTVYFHNNEFGVCSRNLELKEDDQNTLWTVAKSLDLENKLKALDHSYAVQGELIGPGIQKNKYGLKIHNMYVFNVYDITEGKYLNYLEMKEIADKLEVNTVPILGQISGKQTIEELVQLSKGTSQLKADQMREGIVLRPLIEDEDPELGRLSFKVINPDFLLKFEE
ncbi:MAG: RNA ligase (ATP) [Nitrosotalea sp.]